MDANTPSDSLRLTDGLTDPRINRTKQHSLESIMLITLMAVICGAESWTQIELFGESKRKWFKTFLSLPNGIPSHDTFGRVFSLLDPEELENWFGKWTRHLNHVSGSQLIAIDGKTLRQSFDKASKKAAIHMISAWSETNHMILGQLATEAKSNEITAIPQLLKLMDIRDATITIDAMGCQKAIAQQIVEQGGGYVLQVKDNHRALHADIKLLFDEAFEHDFEDMAYASHQTVEKGHGRIETRQCWSTWDIDYFQNFHGWTGLQSVVCVQRTFEQVLTGKICCERRYFISTLDGRDAEKMLGVVRGHWGIENKLHWSLDVAYREDQCRIRKGHGAENFSRMRRFSQNLLKNEKTLKVGIQSKRLQCGWNHDYLLKIVKGLI